MISIRQVEVVRAVMVARSIGGAAQLLNVSAAAVSRMLRHTEAQIGFDLFARTPGGFVPTADALALMPDLVSIHRSLKRIEDRLTHQETSDIPLRIGSSPGLGQSLIPQALSSMRKTHPDIRFELGSLHVDEVIPMLEFDRYDFALTIYELEDPRIETTRIAEAPLVCLMAEDHPLSGAESVTLEEVAKFPMIGYGTHAFQQRMIDGMFRERGLTPDYRARCRLMNTACALVQEEIGLTLLDQFTIFGRIPAGTRVAFLDIDYRFPLNVLTFKDAPLSRLSGAFLAEVKHVLSGKV
ncbi:LysR family transcriptional regulator [Celeribacter indicus]|uniref:LysR family transcriptional regulator n=1 Tax=Celeribacter indicus TaxID=1208324 RepID=A0A0B5E5R2_9RHOB|nr:LysR family transcriptional regulator [Celeribacter indicus]AJE48725.1 LysR family transcriptional regulator [Celeribacter indicus]SDX12043.1 DNA-binding transcriptional regulator, LysR family [Celeribacter indicus]